MAEGATVVTGQLGMVGLGRMGANMTERLRGAGIDVATRFESRGEAEFANRVLSAMRHAFGGHLEKTA
jgi:6-phosphogluconate dehydrogenase (decarboxylating)